MTTAEVCQSEDYFKDEVFGIHPKIGYNYSIFKGDFDEFEGVSNCGTFGNGAGSGIYTGLFVEKNFKQRFFAELGIVFIKRSGKIKVPSEFPSRNGTTGEVVWLTTDNIIDADLGYIEIQPQVSYILSNDFVGGPLKINFGLRGIIPVIANYNYYEQIVSPDNAVFINADGKRSQRRDIADGKITSITKCGLGMNAGLENYLKAGKNSFFTQHIQIDYNLSSIINEGEWNVFAVRLGLGFRFGFKSHIEGPKVAPKPILEPPLGEPPLGEPAVAKAPVTEVHNAQPAVAELQKPINTEKLDIINPEINLAIIDKNLKQYYGNELLATIPIVNAVFFEQNSTELPSLYLFEMRDINFFQIDPLSAHKYLFPRIAVILKNNPKAKIELVGATSGESDEPDGKKLALQRAENVAEALKKCGIPEKKISIKAEILPDMLSNQDFAEGRIENRRVDIVLTNAPLQEYVNFQNFAEIRGDVKLQIDNKGLMPGEQIIIKSEVLNEPLSVRVTDLENRNEFSIPLKIRFDEEKSIYNYLFSASAKNAKDTVTFRFDSDKLDKELINQDISNFKAILRFDYNSGVLSADNKGLLKQLAEKLPEGATINILGSADALGTQARNEQLISERAAVTREFIENINHGKFKYRTGMNKEKFPEASPQGRFLNRSIIITVTKQ
jgi:outer membrane protein OmpA-like peptidoglycan-associated protein